MSVFYEGLAEIFEIDAAAIGSDLVLAEHNWDSLAIVSVIALVDESDNLLLDGSALAKCETIGDIEALIAKAKG